jgi:hypothetical protein
MVLGLACSRAAEQDARGTPSVGRVRAAEQTDAALQADLFQLFPRVTKPLRAGCLIRPCLCAERNTAAALTHAWDASCDCVSSEERCGNAFVVMMSVT